MTPDHKAAHKRADNITKHTLEWHTPTQNLAVAYLDLEEQLQAAQQREQEAIAGAVAVQEACAKVFIGYEDGPYVHPTARILALQLDSIKAGRELLEPMKRDTEHKQSIIDRLMLEYCPDEMTPEQVKKWADAQVPLPIDAIIAGGKP